MKTSNLKPPARGFKQRDASYALPHGRALMQRAVGGFAARDVARAKEAPDFNLRGANPRGYGR